jgi:hypothetical protein
MRRRLADACPRMAPPSSAHGCAAGRDNTHPPAGLGMATSAWIARTPVRDRHSPVTRILLGPGQRNVQISMIVKSIPRMTASEVAKP